VCLCVKDTELTEKHSHPPSLSYLLSLSPTLNSPSSHPTSIKHSNSPSLPKSTHTLPLRGRVRGSVRMLALRGRVRVLLGREGGCECPARHHPVGARHPPASLPASLSSSLSPSLPPSPHIFLSVCLYLDLFLWQLSRCRSCAYELFPLSRCFFTSLSC